MISGGARTWPAYPALSAPLTMLGVERRWFLLSATDRDGHVERHQQHHESARACSVCSTAWDGGHGGRTRTCSPSCVSLSDSKPDTTRRSGPNTRGTSSPPRPDDRPGHDHHRSRTGRPPRSRRAGRRAAVLGMAPRRSYVSHPTRRAGDDRPADPDRRRRPHPRTTGRRIEPLATDAERDRLADPGCISICFAGRRPSRTPTPACRPWPTSGNGSGARSSRAASNRSRRTSPGAMTRTSRRPQPAGTMPRGGATTRTRG